MNFDGDFEGDLHNNNYDEIEVENMGNSNARNQNEGFDDFFGNNQNNAQFAGGEWNLPVANADASLFNEYVVYLLVTIGRGRSKSSCQ